MRYKFFLSRLPKGSSSWTWQIGPEIFTAIGANYDIQDLAVDARIDAMREAQHLRLAITLEGWVEVECDRGQELIRLPITATHEQVYAWDAHYLPDEGIEEFFTLGPREDEIDLTQALYDYIGLAIPRRRVRPGCPDAACPPHIHTYLQMPDEG